MEIGNIVILRNNTKCIVANIENNNVLVNIDTGTYFLLEEYNDYNHLMEDIYDIMIVYNKSKIVWERSFLSIKEKHLLELINKQYKYIAKDNDGEVYIYTDMPQKRDDTWFVDDEEDYESLTTYFDAFKSMPTTKAYRIEDLIK